MREFILLFAIIAIVYANNFSSCGECKKFVEIAENVKKACEQMPHDENHKDCEAYVKIATTELPPAELCETMKLCPPKPKKYWLGFLG